MTIFNYKNQKSKIKNQKSKIIINFCLINNNVRNYHNMH